MSLTIEPWFVYAGSSTEPAPVATGDWLDKIPPWRQSSAVPLERPAPDLSPAETRRGATYVTTCQEELEHVNLSLLLRKPLLLTGLPGLGKSSLIYSIAHRLSLGKPLVWAINSETTLKDGLYHYDAVGHLRASQQKNGKHIGEFITLGPLGTALLPSAKPRALLIDEIDKANFDLPNDLLRALEDGCFAIPELVREGGEALVVPFDAAASPDGKPDRAKVPGGRVERKQPPVVIITSNEEREFSEAFKRRCVSFRIEYPLDPKVLTAIVESQLGESFSDEEIIAAQEKMGEPRIEKLLNELFGQRRFGLPPGKAGGML